MKVTLATMEISNKLIKESVKKYFNNLNTRNYYLLTTTYRPKFDNALESLMSNESSERTKVEVNNIFCNFYTSKFLPFILNKRHYTKSSYIDPHILDKQPITLTIPELHKKSNQLEKYHHHSFIAVKDYTESFLNLMHMKEKKIQPHHAIEQRLIKEKQKKIQPHQTEELKKIKDKHNIFFDIATSDIKRASIEEIDYVMKYWSPSKDVNCDSYLLFPDKHKYISGITEFN